MRAFFGVMILVSGCGMAEPAPADGEPPESAAPPAVVPAAAEQTVGPRPQAWVRERVAEARERLASTPAGREVWAAIDAHGGLEAWLAASTLAFTFDYQPLDAPERRMHTRNRVDHWSARARQDEREGGAGAEATLGWDGREAWIMPAPEAFPTTARFWALTPYYFVGMPFVAADPGVNITALPDAELDGVAHRLVKLSYGEGIGDAPDDYYILYLHPETHRLAALRYVVSYPGFFPEGGHSPEKLMRYDGWHDAGGLRLAGTLDTFRWDAEAGRLGPLVTRIVVSEIAVGETWSRSIFARPEGAVQSGLGG